MQQDATRCNLMVSVLMLFDWDSYPVNLVIRTDAEVGIS